MDVSTLLRLDGKVALVGGSTSGIGKAIATAFAAAGAEVILMARNEEKLKNTRDGLSGEGHSFLVADYSKPDQVRAAIHSYIEQGNQVDILVNNTGGPAPGPVLQAEPEDYLTAYKMHLICNQILTKAVVPSMKANGWGRIINIISTSVRQPIPNLGVSNTTRGAVGNWAKTLANELGEFNITVNNILPGPIRTPRMTQIIKDRAEAGNKTFEEAEADMASAVPMGRIGEPPEIGKGALFLASDAASYVNGTNLIIDGGRTKTY